MSRCGGESELRREMRVAARADMVSMAGYVVVLQVRACSGEYSAVWRR